MILERLYLGCLAQASYFVADEASGVACVIDPRRDIEEYLALANARGVRIEHVLLTHVHADFVAGHLELRARCGAQIHLGAAASTEFAFSPMRDGGSLRLGPEVELRFLETPGHTPEGVCILLEQESRAHAVFTGDTLFCGEVGRPDLLVGAGLKAEDLAGMLYDSLRAKLLPLDDAVIVYPGHGAGSACGKNISADSHCTMGQQRDLNWALQDMPRESFIERLTTDLPLAPAYFALDAQWNRQERDPLPDVLSSSLRPLAPEDFLRRAGEGAQVVDTRHTDEFADGHLRGSYFLGLSGQYASWAGAILDPEQPILLVVNRGQEEEAATRLGRIGFDGVVGYLDGDVDELRNAGAMVDSFERVRSGNAASTRLVDVRERGEQLAAPLPDSFSLPLSEFARDGVAMLDGLPKEAKLTMVCAGGYRSMIAASLLRRAGYEHCNDYSGGTDALLVRG